MQIVLIGKIHYSLPIKIRAGKHILTLVTAGSAVESLVFLLEQLTLSHVAELQKRKRPFADFEQRATRKGWLM